MFNKWLLRYLKVGDGAGGQGKDTWLFFSCCCLEDLLLADTSISARLMISP